MAHNTDLFLLQEATTAIADPKPIPVPIVDILDENPVLCPDKIVLKLMNTTMNKIYFIFLLILFLTFKCYDCLSDRAISQQPFFR